MTDHKFTDDDVIKALECCSKDVPIRNSCEGCPFAGKKCAAFLPQTALDLINRQKAEIERLNVVHADMTESLRLAAEANKDMQAEIEAQEEEYADLLGQRNAVEMMLDISRAEAIKDFAENVKAIFECVLYFDDDVKECILNEIDELVKEMTGET